MTSFHIKIGRMHFAMTVKYLWALSSIFSQFSFDFHLQRKWVLCHKSCCCIKNEWCVVRNPFEWRERAQNWSEKKVHDTVFPFADEEKEMENIFGKWFVQFIEFSCSSHVEISSWALNLQFNWFLIAFWTKLNQCLVLRFGKISIFCFSSNIFDVVSTIQRISDWNFHKRLLLKAPINR